MKLSQDFKRFGLVVFAGFALSGCMTGNGGGDGSTTTFSPTEQADGGGPAVTAEGQVRHEEECVPIAETDRVQPPSVEMGVARDLGNHSAVQAYTRYNCR